jgi:hypothetical protein
MVKLGGGLRGYRILLGRVRSGYTVTLEVTSGDIGTENFSDFDTGFFLSGSDFLIHGAALGGSGGGLIAPVPDPLHHFFQTIIPGDGAGPPALINGVEYSGFMSLNFVLDAPLFPLPFVDDGQQDFFTPFTMTGRFTATDGSVFDLRGSGIAHSTFIDLCPVRGYVLV